MPVTLTTALPPGQDSYLGNMYLGIETYLRRSGTGHGFPAASAAPPDERQGLASRVGQAAHDDTGLRSPVPGNRRQQREPRPYRTQIPRSGASQTTGLRPHHHARSASRVRGVSPPGIWDLRPQQLRPVAVLSPGLLSEPVLWDAPPVEPPLSSAGPAWVRVAGTADGSQGLP